MSAEVWTEIPPEPPGWYDEPATRQLRLAPASSIRLRPVRWLWADRLALGTLALLAGREGLGKSTVAYWLAARITRGELAGESHGRPRAVIVAATEDSWEHTIGPRLVAAGADLDKVFRVDVVTSEGTHASLTLPLDNRRLEEAVAEVGAALILLDPLMSRIDAGLDSHKDADVRRALEPVVSLAHRTGTVVLALIHLNKGAHTDPLSMVMGSRAFTAVARSVLVATPSPDDETIRMLGQGKNNLGRLDLPSLLFRIVTAEVATDEGPAYTGVVEWLGETTQTLADAMRDGGDPEVRTATSEAAAWLKDYLEVEGGQVESSAAKKAGAAAGHNVEALKRARRRLGLAVESVGYPRRTWWSLPVRSQSGQPSGESEPTNPTNPTDPTGTQSGQSGQSDRTPREADPTDTADQP